MLGLYIHIPFCHSICPYCDFCKSVSNENRQKEYVKALCTELKIKNINNYSFNTVYIGGGTPSSISLKLLETLLESLTKTIDVNKLIEFTIEVNPQDINEELVKILSKYHITRVSIGVQTFVPKLQKLINRFITEEELNKKINLLNNYQINNINVDLMYAIPSQTLEDVDIDLSIVTKLNITHISYYSLILEEHTIFYHLVKQNKLKLISEDLEAKMYHHICNILRKNKFNRYETSNFAKKGYRSIHNLIYWNCDEYLSLGASGSSYYNHCRFTTTNNINKYIQGINNHKVELDETINLSMQEEKKEAIILGLRKKQGIDINKFKQKFGISIFDAYPNINYLIEEGSLKLNYNHVYIPDKYVYITNHIILKII